MGFTRLKPDREIYGHNYRAYADIDVTYRPSNPNIGVFIRVTTDDGFMHSVEIPQVQFARLVYDYLSQRGLEIAVDEQ